MPSTTTQPSPLQGITTTLPIDQTQQLYQSRATHYLDRLLGVQSCLPHTARAHPGGLAGWNPAQHPWVMDRDQDKQQLRCLLWVDPQLAYFVGHFPGQPILPGVVQLDWAIAFAAQHWSETTNQANYCGMQNLKFKQPIEPGELLQLVLTQQPGKIDFVFATPAEVRSQGTLLYRA